ncbi:hypothetical protein IWZ00DRAFT_504369 [Phyllosticta capitalensis]
MTHIRRLGWDIGQRGGLRVYIPSLFPLPLCLCLALAFTYYPPPIGFQLRAWCGCKRKNRTRDAALRHGALYWLTTTHPSIPLPTTNYLRYPRPPPPSAGCRTESSMDTFVTTFSRSISVTPELAVIEPSHHDRDRCCSGHGESGTARTGYMGGRRGPGRWRCAGRTRG